MLISVSVVLVDESREVLDSGGFVSTKLFKEDCVKCVDSNQSHWKPLNPLNPLNTDIPYGICRMATKGLA